MTSPKRFVTAEITTSGVPGAGFGAGSTVVDSGVAVMLKLILGLRVAGKPVLQPVAGWYGATGVASTRISWCAVRSSHDLTCEVRTIRGAKRARFAGSGLAVGDGWQIGRSYNVPMYVVIMAGGGGTRLRPLSTAGRPKPFLPLLPTGETLLQRTIARLRGPELGLSDDAIVVVASAAYAPLVHAQAPGIQVVVEPEGRNTAAAIALAALAISRDDDEVMVVLPADHRIDPSLEGRFREVLRRAADHLATGAFGIAAPLVTLGIAPSHPSTQYGYLVPRVEAGADVGGLRAYPLAAFREKPDAAAAAQLVASPGVAWNAGMFLWRRRAILAALERHAPDVLSGVAAGLDSGDLAAAYPHLPSRSIDYAVMEPAGAAGEVVMAGLDVGWSDIGTWPALLEVLGAEVPDGGVLEAGAAATVSARDLLVERGPAGLAVREAPEGTISPDQPIALLRGARDARPVVQALLDRCAAAEARA